MSTRKMILITGKLHATRQESKDQFTRLAATFPKGVIVRYPTIFSEPTATWNDSIRSDISSLMMCDELHLLPNWQGHKRSEILRDIALRIGIKVHYH